MVEPWPTPPRAFADPVVLANAVTFLAMPASDNVTGHEFCIDGGPVPTNDLRIDRKTAVRSCLEPATVIRIGDLHRR